MRSTSDLCTFAFYLCLLECLLLSIGTEKRNFFLLTVINYVWLFFQTFSNIPQLGVFDCKDDSCFELCQIGKRSLKTLISGISIKDKI